MQCRPISVTSWFNPYRVANHTDPTRLAASHPARLHPEWVLPYGGKLYYNPGLPEVRSFVQDAMLDAVRRYAIDAVHWDDYFYRTRWRVRRSRTTPPTSGTGRPGPGRLGAATTPTGWSARWASGPGDRQGVRFSISPFAVWRNASTDPLGSDTRAGVENYDDLHADTRKWVKEGWIDYIAPQIYWHIGLAAADYAKVLAWWSATVRGAGVGLYVGEALYKAGDPAQPAPWQDPAESPATSPSPGTTRRWAGTSSSPPSTWRPTGSGRWPGWSPTTTRTGCARRAEGSGAGAARTPAPALLMLVPGRLDVLDDAVGAGGHQVLVAVGEPDPVRRGAPVPEYFDDLCDPVVLSHGPAVHQQPVARVCLHRG
ncbi:hypothetical protein SMICM17S_06733 [Streptomyces microflavus]